GLNASIKSFISSLVGVSASGNLTLSADATLHLRLGLDLSIASISTTQNGDASHNEQQTLVLKATSGTFALTFPFQKAPQGLTVSVENTGGSLAAGTYDYVVTALMPAESPKSAEVSATVVAHGTDHGKVHLSWNAVAGATGYRVYRG